MGARRPQSAGARAQGRGGGRDRFPDPGTIKYRKAEVPLGASGSAGLSPYEGGGDPLGGSRGIARPRSASLNGRGEKSGRSLGGLGASTRSVASMVGSEKSFTSLRREDKAFDRYLRIREGTFDLGPSESYQRPVYNALLDPVMGEYFDRGGRRRHLVKSKMVNEYGELNGDRKFYELHYREVRQEKEKEQAFDREIRDELSERHKAVMVRTNQNVEERRLNRINEIREDHRERVNRIRQVAMKRLEKYSGPGNFWLAYKAADAFASLLKREGGGGGGQKPWEEPGWEDRAVRMIQSCWRARVARRVVEEKKRVKAEEEAERNARAAAMKARAARAAGGAYKSPSLVTHGSFKKSEAFKQGSASMLQGSPTRTASGKLIGLGPAGKGGRALEDMSPLEAYTLEDRKNIIRIQAAARARKAKKEVTAIRLSLVEGAEDEE